MQKGQWVRLKKAPYNGDIAQVTAVNNAQQRVQVKLIPRFQEDDQVNVRAQQKFFVPADHGLNSHRDN